MWLRHMAIEAPQSLISNNIPNCGVSTTEKIARIHINTVPDTILPFMSITLHVSSLFDQYHVQNLTVHFEIDIDQFIHHISAFIFPDRKLLQQNRPPRVELTLIFFV